MPNRNIPAYAGKTAHRDLCHTQRQEHPRIRGENKYVADNVVMPVGTSPHTRGKLNDTQPRVRLVRNIPAYAGKTRFSSRFCRFYEEHPRIRGENRKILQKMSIFGGTSPHTRGKLASSSFSCLRTRNIPAYAGKTSRSPQTR